MYKKICTTLLFLAISLIQYGCDNTEANKLEVDRIMGDIKETIRKDNLRWEVWQSTRSACIASRDYSGISDSKYDQILEICGNLADSASMQAMNTTNEDNIKSQHDSIIELIDFGKENQNIFPYIQSEIVLLSGNLTNVGRTRVSDTIYSYIDADRRIRDCKHPDFPCN